MMAITNQHLFEEYQPINISDDDYSEDEDSKSEYDSDDDPSYDILEDSHSNLAKLSIKNKGKSRLCEDSDSSDDAEVQVDIPVLEEKDQKSLETVHELIQAGKLEKLKIDQCKVYLRNYGLRLTGNKNELLQRIKEHLEIINGGWEKNYPPSNFIVNCKGDACVGDVVIFQQNVYDKFSIVSRSASGPPCGKAVLSRKVMVLRSNNIHTFARSKTLTSSPPASDQGFNTMRQVRQRGLMEKHSRGRSDREARVQEKEQSVTIK